MAENNQVTVKRIQAKLEPDMYEYYLKYKSVIQTQLGFRLSDSQALNAMLKEVKCKNLLAA